MDLIAAIIAAVLGWKHGTSGQKELKAIALVVVGWTAVTAVATIPFTSIGGIVFLLIYRTLLIGLPYLAGVLVKRWRTRKG